MSKIHAFPALRPEPAMAAQVSAVPYDVVNVAEARQFSEGNPWSFLRVSRAELELADGVNPYADQVYERARANFEKLRKDAPLVKEAEPSLYVYRLKMGDHSQTGICAAFSVDEYEANKILKHEKTRRDKEDDRTRHITTLRAQTGPVFLAYRGVAAINSIVDRVTAGAPLFDVTAPDGIAHTIWRVPGELTGALIQAFEQVPQLYIADGHHRAASAARARTTMRTANPSHTGEEEYNYFLAVVFPAEQLRIMPYNRVARDLRCSPAEFLDRVRAHFVVQPDGPASPRAKGDFAMYLQGKWYLLRRLPSAPARKGPIDTLDVSVLQDELLSPLLGIQDPRTDKRIDFVGGIRGTAELERRVNSGEMAVAFSLYPVTMDDLFAVADAGEIMPPKSTWFEPKLRDGFLSHLI
ncbi:MAG: DUF1015 family protein [Acidobacteriota bacterium]